MTDKPPMGSRIDGFDEHATAIGYMCFHFASMEGSVNRMLANIFGSMPIARAVADASGTSLDNRLTLLVKLASLASLPEEWFGAVDDVTDSIKRNILPIRNRLIHDEWYATEKDTFGQTDVKTRLIRLQSRQPKIIPNPLRSEREMSAIWQLAQDCIDADTDITMLSGDIRLAKETGQYQRMFAKFRGPNPANYRARPAQADQAKDQPPQKP